MRLLITTDTLGGVWTFTRELCSGLLAAGDSVCLVSFGRTPSPAQRADTADLAAQASGRFQFHSSAAPLEWMDANEHAYADGVSLLRAGIRDFGPDLLHCNQFCYGSLGNDLPVILTLHSDVLSWADACRPALAATPSPWLERYCAYVRSGIAHAHTLVAPTQWMLDAFRHHFPVVRPCAVIPNGIDIPETPAGSAPQRKAQCVSAGRFWDEGKGMAMLAQLRSPWPVVVAGEAPSALPSLTLSYTGSLSLREVHRLFRESAIYLCTSLYEPFGLAPLEAALCGCAVLARDLPSLREVWGDAALYFREVAELEAALHCMCGDPATLQAAQQRSFARATLYTRARMTHAYRALYTRAAQPAAELCHG